MRRQVAARSGEQILTTETTRPTNVVEAAILPLKRYARFAGRSSRMEFWSYTLAVNVVQTALTMIAAPLAWPLSLALLLPSLAVLVRRLHDVNRSGWWALPIPILLPALFLLYGMTLFDLGNEAGKQIFISGGVLLVALAGFGISLLVWTCRRGTPGPNRFGEPG
ncbi:MAG: DUF805 domain-containing protein [Cytophagaceae bacterium]|nr:MAG: DUF805 domain-containing protein [Cytophagaceae bacterium]